MSCYKYFVGSSGEMTVREMARLGGLKGGPARMASMTEVERKEFAARGGKAGGTARAAALSAGRRSEIARNAARARWQKKVSGAVTTRGSGLP